MHEQGCISEGTEAASYVVDVTKLLCEWKCVDASLSDVFSPPMLSLSDKMWQDTRLKHVSEGPLRFLW